MQRYGQPVLDVGCATCRIVLDYLAQGIDTDGVDNSPELLAICRDKAALLERVVIYMSSGWKRSICRAPIGQSWCLRPAFNWSLMRLDAMCSDALLHCPLGAWRCADHAFQS